MGDFSSKATDNERSLESDGGIDLDTTSTKPPSPTPNFKTTSKNNSTSNTIFQNQPRAYIIQHNTTTVIPVCQPPSYSQSQVSPLKRKLPTCPTKFQTRNPPSE